MKIGIFSGTFDPVHNGHLWIIEEAAQMFDEVHVVIGPNPYKEPVFDVEARLHMLRETVRNGNVTVEVMKTQNIAEFANELVKGTENTATILRGIRDLADTSYESGILKNMRAKYPHLHTAFLVCPDHLKDARSSYVREMARVGVWSEVVQHCPNTVVKALVEQVMLAQIRAKKPGRLNKSGSGFPCKWMVASPNVASIFETATAGFAPSEGKHEEDNPQHKIGMRDLYNSYEPNPWLEAQAGYFDKAVKNKIFRIEEQIAEEQVEAMLDPVPVEVVTSKTFHLKWIKISSVQPTGGRYLPCSRSIGPIIVDYNTLPGPLAKNVIGPAIIIEGKHRWLDARERGEDRILAWVGDKALPFVTVLEPARS